MTLKNLFPLSFKYKNGLINMILGIIVYLIVGAIAGLLIGFAGLLVGWIPVVGGILIWVLNIVSSIVGIWSLVGIIVLVLAFLGLGREANKSARTAGAFPFLFHLDKGSDIC